VATLACDVLVLGSSLGGLVAASYLGRLGLRVIVIEEESQAKRPALLREPLMLCGLSPTGPIRGVLRELGVPLREQMLMERDELSVQVILPETQLDLFSSAGDWVRELEVKRLLPRAPASAWLERSGALAARVRQELARQPSRFRFPGSWWATRERDESAPAIDVPDSLQPLLRALAGALYPLPPSPFSAAAQLGVMAALEGAYHMPNASESFLELFRRRIRCRHGDIQTTDSFRLSELGNEIEVGLPRGAFRARGLVVAAPLEPLRRMLDDTGGAPAWWLPAPEPVHCPTRLFRIHSNYVPQGMGHRVIAAGEGEGELHWFTRLPDAELDGVEWLLAAGPGLHSQVSMVNPLQRQAPFLRNTVVPTETGPEPRWDLSASEIRLHQSPRFTARSRVPRAHVGPERAALFGFEGEVLQARQAALQLATRLGARRLV
jgi:glycine/D-amino acid oxidase-like deaminating enzyme